ncbi:Alpha/beta hydrolase [Micromonospora pattaloongensis]|uniref:Alpha/beta hydrolase n=1 Tax=Micromonospora pattaloongensis TaxID=405436 RepID=A0A1H3MII7_9ACTN|nr:alpha/beta hydrolase [Micromonospora pattaloongensis]SDY76164.1 Alpha/beta hydrolase [Micromonospora pattaloongensis]
MITYEQLWAADPTAWRAAGAAWHGADAVIGARCAELDSTTAALRTRWSGPAGGAARRRVTELRDRVDGSRLAFVAVDQVLAELGAELARARAMLEAAVAAADRMRVLVDRRGGVTVDPALARPDGPTLAGARRVAGQIRAALDVATAADRTAARELSALTTAAAQGWVAHPTGSRPPAGADPAGVRRWWDGLTPAERRWLIRHETALVGSLDGVPVRARDQANRLLLAEERARLDQRRAAALAERPIRYGRLARVDGLLAGLDAIEARLTHDGGPRAYLLGLSAAGDGRAIVSVGDPDRAANVLTYVPGMTSDLPSVAGELDRAYRVAARCAELGPAERTAAVLWLDYDAPDFIGEASRASQAHDAGPALHRFQEGLRATHEGPPAHQTVLGHSYGSLVVGATARDHGLAADSLVFVGSPGVGVDRATDLHMPAGEVWSSTAGNDVIRLAGPRQLLRVAVLGPPLLALTEPDDQLWFGRDPTAAEFGARVFGGAPRGHVGYWEPGNPALDGMARVVLGAR